MTPFASDNISSACPEIIEAVIAANTGNVPSYGDDQYTALLTEKLGTIFETSVNVFPTVTGTASNAIAISALAKGYNRVYCHQLSHVNTDECGAPELFSGGAKLHALPGKNLKLATESLAQNISGDGNVHVTQPSVVSITQANEAGGVYTLEEITAICEVAHRHQLKVHMDGARFANALATLQCSPADMTWRAGVDILSFGGTKNGCLAAEAIVVFPGVDTTALPFLHKRAGQLLSKMRFVSSQLLAYVDNDLWLNNAKNANAMAQRMVTGLRKIEGINLVYPVQSNEIFLTVEKNILDHLATHDIEFNGGELDGSAYRLVMSWNTDKSEVDDFLNLLQQANNP